MLYFYRFSIKLQSLWLIYANSAINNAISARIKTTSFLRFADMHSLCRQRALKLRHNNSNDIHWGIPLISVSFLSLRHLIHFITSLFLCCSVHCTYERWQYFNYLAIYLQRLFCHMCTWKIWHFQQSIHFLHIKIVTGKSN